MTAQNFLVPAEDLGFRLDYKQPYLWGPADPRRSALAISAFNSRKLSGVFMPGECLAGAQSGPSPPGVCTSSTAAADCNHCSTCRHGCAVCARPWQVL